MRTGGYKISRRKILSRILVSAIIILSLNPQTTKADTATYQLTKVIQPTVPTENGFFGLDIAVFGDTMVVGERGAAKVHIYTRSGEPIITLSNPDGSTNSLFGWSLSIFGEHIVVGDPAATVNGLEKAGAIYFYDLQGNPEWSRAAKTPQANGYFGFSMANDGRRLAVGEPGMFGFGNVTSRVYIYNLSGEYTRSFQEPTNSTGYFGWSVAVNGDEVVVGEPYTWYASGDGGTHGLVHIRSLSDPEAERILKSPLGLGFGNYGNSIAINDYVLTIGEVRGDVNSTEMAGTVHLYEPSGQFIRTLYPQKPSQYGYFGIKVKVSDEYVLVNQKGHIYLYDHLGNMIVDVADEARSQAAFGLDCVIDGELLVAGVDLASVQGTMCAGEVRLFKVQMIADIHLVSLAVAKVKVAQNEKVGVNIQLENLGRVVGNYTIMLMMDGVEVGTIPVSVYGGSTENRTLSVSSTVVGLHQVTVEDKSAVFEVEQQQGVPGYAPEFVLLGVVLSSVILWILGRREKK